MIFFKKIFLLDRHLHVNMNNCSIENKIIKKKNIKHNLLHVRVGFTYY